MSRPIVNCEKCGRPAAALATCPHCMAFVPVTLALSDPAVTLALSDPAADADREISVNHWASRTAQAYLDLQTTIAALSAEKRALRNTLAATEAALIDESIARNKAEADKHKLSDDIKIFIPALLKALTGPRPSEWQWTQIQSVCRNYLRKVDAALKGAAAPRSP